MRSIQGEQLHRPAEGAERRAPERSEERRSNGSSPVGPTNIPTPARLNLSGSTLLGHHSVGRPLRLEPMDSPLVSIGEARLFPGPNNHPAPQGGVHFCLLNNAWNTNHPQWISGNGRSRILMSP